MFLYGDIYTETSMYTEFVSDEPLEIIRINEAEKYAWSTEAHRFRRLFNELELQAAHIKELERDLDALKDARNSGVEKTYEYYSREEDEEEEIP